MPVASTVMALVLAGGCSSDDPIDDFIGGSNRADLEGEPIGAADGSDFRRELTVSPTREEPDLELGAMWAIHRSADFSGVVMPVTNRAATGRCFIEFGRVRYLDESGAQVPNQLGLTFVDGSVAVSDFVATSTCLASGETGYFLSWVDEAFGRLAGVEFTVDPGRPDYRDPVSTLVPQAYEPTDEGLSVTATCEGEDSCVVDGITVVFFDDQGIPVGHTLELYSDPIEVQPDETSTFDVSVDPWRSSSVTVFMDFAPGSLAI